MMLASGRILPVARGIALFLSLFTLLNILGDLLSPGFDSNIWWIDLGGRGGLPQVFLAAAALVLLLFAIRPPVRPLLRLIVQVAAISLLVVTLLNALTFYVLMFRHVIRPGVPVPLSLFIMLCVILILVATLAKRGSNSAPPGSKIRRIGCRIAMAVSFLACLVIFPLAQMYCFGKTDYRRPADAIVVFGALAHPDGTPSQALADRVNTAIALYKDGYAPVLIFSGGPSGGPLSEPDVMRNLALAAGVPESAIVLDQGGFHTDASVTNTTQLFRERQFHTILAVSHFYHLPRIKMTYARSLHDHKSNVEVLTVPAHESRPLVAMPHFVLREIFALYAYYLRPLLPR